MIKGTVTDQSAGAKDTPAISDESMDAWMTYLYMQFPRPTNATGVPLSIDAVDPNGNFIHIGNTTSDQSGTFGYRWVTPEGITGQYTVIATFAGSKSYWPSYSETSFSVDPAASTPSPYPVTVLPPTEMYIGAAAAAIIVAIAIVGVIIVMMLRKRP
jgi:hypothetical protein